MGKKYLDICFLKFSPVFNTSQPFSNTSPMSRLVISTVFDSKKIEHCATAITAFNHICNILPKFTNIPKYWHLADAYKRFCVVIRDFEDEIVTLSGYTPDCSVFPSRSWACSWTTVACTPKPGCPVHFLLWLVSLRTQVFTLITKHLVRKLDCPQRASLEMRLQDGNWKQDLLLILIDQRRF